MKNLGDEIWNKIKEKNLQIDAESMHIGGAKNLEDKINILLKEINEIEEEKDRYYYHTGKINEEDNKEKIILTIDEVESQADLSKEDKQRKVNEYTSKYVNISPEERQKIIAELDTKKRELIVLKNKYEEMAEKIFKESKINKLNTN